MVMIIAALYLLPSLASNLAVGLRIVMSDNNRRSIADAVNQPNDENVVHVVNLFAKKSLFPALAPTKT